MIFPLISHLSAGKCYNTRMKKIRQDIENQDFSHIYLITGEEAYLRLRTRDLLADAIVPAEDTMNRSVFSGSGHDPRAIADLAETLPFFAERRLIILENTGFFKTPVPELAEELRRCPDYCYFLFIEEETDARSALGKAIRDLGYTVNCARLNEQQLMNFAARYLMKAGRKIRTADMTAFLTAVGDDLFTVTRELDKLISCTEGKDVVEREDMEAITSIRTENRIFDMVRAVTEKKRKEALRLYADLLALRERPQRILSLLTRQYGQIYRAMLLSREGQKVPQIASDLHVPAFAVRRYLGLLGSLTPSALTDAITACAEAEESFKSGKMRDSLALELLLVSLLS